LDFDFGRLKAIVDENTLCIVSPHLLGQIADIQQAQSIAQPHQIPVVEDAAQAMGVKFNGRWLGTQGEIGFFSLGRGKCVTAGSGGVILTNSDDLGRKLDQAVQEVPESSVSSQIVNVMMVAAMNLLIVPRLYWLPAGLPFLGLGETIFYRDFPIYRMDGIRSGLLTDWRKRLEQSNEIRKQWAEEYLAQFHADLDQLEPSRVAGRAYLRIPVVMPSAVHKRHLCALSVEQGLGVSPLYPTAISEIQHLKAFFKDQQFPGATVLAKRLVTLPTHCYLEAADLERICLALRTIVNEPRSAVGDPH
jgi:perosamine synthetase